MAEKSTEGQKTLSENEKIARCETISPFPTVFQKICTAGT